MKKITIIALLLIVYLTSFSQNILTSPVIVYSVSENSIIKRGGKEINLDSLLICHVDDELEVIKGKVCAYNGSELYLNPGDKINIVQKKNAQPNSVDKISRFINEPSTFLPNLYNNTRSSSLSAFPAYSVVYNTKNIDIVIPQKLHNKLNWSLYQNNNDSLIIEIEEVAADFIPDTLKLLKGKTYYWKLFNKNTIFTGRIKVIKSLKGEAKMPENLISKSDYFNAFNLFIDNECIFDAIATLKEGHINYPDCKIILNLLLMFPYNKEI